MDNTELVQRIEKLEKQVELLQTEINAIKNIELSERTRKTIDKIEQANKLVNLMENLSGESLIDARKNEELEVQKNIYKQAETEIKSSMDIIGEFIGNSTDESDFEWQAYRDGVEITKYVGFDKKTVIVPELLNGIKIIKIGKEVFLNCKELHHIILPETIIELGEGVFRGSGLEEITLPSQILKIPEWAFASSNVAVVKCPLHLEEIDDCAFKYCHKLTTINLPKSLKRLGNHCFNTTCISNIIIPSNDVVIGEEIFNRFEKHTTNIAFLGMNDSFYIYNAKSFPGHLEKNFVFYCLPGSSAQQYARQNDIPVKHLSEFDNDIKEEN